MSVKKLMFFGLALAKAEFAQSTLTIPLTRKTRSGQPVTPLKNHETDNFIFSDAAVTLLSMDTNDTAIGDPTFHLDLTNYLDYQYFGPLYIGST